MVHILFYFSGFILIIGIISSLICFVGAFFNSRKYDFLSLLVMSFCIMLVGAYLYFPLKKGLDKKSMATVHIGCTVEQ